MSEEQSKNIVVNNDLSRVVAQLKKKVQEEKAGGNDLTNYVDKKDDVLKEVLSLRKEIVEKGWKTQDIQTPSRLRKMGVDKLCEFRTIYNNILSKGKLKQKALDSVDLKRTKEEVEDRFEQGFSRERVAETLNDPSSTKKDSVAASMAQFNILLAGILETTLNTYRDSLDEDRRETLPDISGFYKNLYEQKNELKNIYGELVYDHEELFQVVSSPWLRLAMVQGGCLANTITINSAKKKLGTGEGPSDSDLDLYSQS